MKSGKNNLAREIYKLFSQIYKQTLNQLNYIFNKKGEACLKLDYLTIAFTLLRINIMNRASWIVNF